MHDEDQRMPDRGTTSRRFGREAAARRARGGTVAMQVGPASETLAGNKELLRLGDGGPVPTGARIVARRRFEEVARTSPDRTAVAYYDEALTYGELNARADALARRLREAGVERERIVGICLPRRLDALVGVLAAMKSGGA